MSDFLGSGWKFPLALESVDNDQAETKDTLSVIATSEDEQSIKESIMIILSTAKGERLMRPEFGCDINRLVFEVNNNATKSLVGFHVTQALKLWEPRIQVLDVQAEIDGDDRNKLNVNIEYKIRTSNAKANLVFPFYLQGKVA